MFNPCCCGCDVVWDDDYSADLLTQYTKTGTWSRTSNMLVGTSGSRIIGPGNGVSYFRIDMPWAFSTGTLGTNDELKLIIRWVDSNNYIYGRVKNNGGSDSQLEIWKVVSGTATQLMATDYFSTTSDLTSGSNLTITDRNGVITFAWKAPVLTANAQSDLSGIWYNYEAIFSGGSEHTISVYVPGSPAKCGIEIVSSATDLKFDNWFAGSGKKDLTETEDYNCYRVLSRENIGWQLPERYTFDVAEINGLPGGWTNNTIKAYWNETTYNADGCAAGVFFAYKDPTDWINPAVTTGATDALQLSIVFTSGGYRFQLITYEPTGGYQWYYSDSVFPIDPTAGDIEFTRAFDTSVGPLFNSSNALPMPATLTMSIVN